VLDEFYHCLLRVVKNATVSNPTVRQLCILMHLDNHGDITVRRAAQLFHISRPAVSANATRLEKQHMLRRKPDPERRHSVLLSITPQGHAYLTNVLSSDGRSRHQTEI
jgi:DNA-binding MarR family transcriptional regulator